MNVISSSAGARINEDVAGESADVVLIGNNLLKLRDALRIARSCRSIIYQNFYGTLAIDLVGIVLAAYGFLTPLLAALIHVTSELAFILNSTRLLPSRRVDAVVPVEKVAQAA